MFWMNVFKSHFRFKDGRFLSTKKIMLKTTFRFLWRNRFVSGINIFGLAVGMCSCMLIYMFVDNELRYDQHHSKKERIFRLVSEMKLGGEEDQMGLSSYMLSPTLKKDYPEVEESIRLMPINKQTVWIDKKPFQFEDNFMSDPGFFRIFDYEFIEGDPKSALAEPGSAVINEDVARTLFGTTTGVLGKTIQYARLPYKVTAVVKEEKNNSHLYFNTLLSVSSLNPGLVTQLSNDWFYMAQTNYVLLKKESDITGFQAKLDQLRDTYILPWLKTVNSEGSIRFKPQPITEIHLDKVYKAGYSRTGNASYIYIFSIVAFFILIIACINYINLATATSGKRAKEIGVRKTAGADKGMLFRQFILESFVTTGFAIVLAMILLVFLMPLFNKLTEKSLHIPFSIPFVSIIAFLLLFIGTVAGSYPAFYLSGMQAVQVLKSRNSPGTGTNRLRKGLVALQFFISVSFILGTIVVFSQMHFMKNTHLGFTKDQLLVVSVPVADSSFVNRFEVVKSELKRHPSILKIAGTGSIPGKFSGMLLHSIEEPGKQRIEKGIEIMTISYDFLDIMDMKLVKGRNFSKEYKTDDTAAFLVNETAVRTYGWRDPFVCTLENGFGYKGKVIGVVKDFHFASLHQPVSPLVMMLNTKLQGFLLVKIAAGKEKEVLNHVEKVWGQYSHKYPMEAFFLDETFEKLYRNEDKMMQIFAYFSILSIIISCLGLYALVTFSLEQRVKEIGIRKVLGAGLPDIFMAIGKDFLFLVAVASALAIPVAGYALHHWLQDFANRISLEWWMFGGSLILVFFIAFATLIARILPAASANPVVSLRTE